MLTFKFTGADGVMTVQETLTTGMVGKQVRIEFTSDWDGLQKTAVFVAGDVSRAVINVEELVTIPAEVLRKPNQRLYVGIYGMNGEGTLIIPTIMAKGPKIEKGAEPSDDPTTDPDPAVWQQMLTAIGDLNDLDTTAKTSLVAAINEVFSKSGSGSGGITAAQISALDGMFKVAAFTKADVSAEYSAFCTAFGIENGGEEEPDEPVTPEVTLSSISATYSGGDVTVGTALSDLTGLVVTAHYSDGSQQNVTGYTLSGEIAEGENTITVTYQGLTTTFTVNGASTPAKDWTSGTAYDLTGKITIGVRLADSGGTESANESYASSDYFNCFDADYVFCDVGVVSVHFYDINKNWISRGYLNSVPNAHRVPDDAVYFRLAANATYLTESVSVIPITKINNFIAGEQSVEYVSGVINTTTGETENGSSVVVEMLPLGGASSLSVTMEDGSAVTIGRIALYDANKNYIYFAQSRTTPIDFTVSKNVGFQAFSYASLQVYPEYSGATITLT